MKFNLTKNKIDYRLVAAICFILWGVTCLLDKFFYGHYGFVFLKWCLPLIVSLIMSSIFLFFKRNKLFLLSISCYFILYEGRVLHWNWNKKWHFHWNISCNLYNFIYIIPFITLIALFILTLQQKEMVYKIWFLPCVFYFIVIIIHSIKYYPWINDLEYTGLMAIISFPIKISAFLFTGLYCKNEVKIPIQHKKSQNNLFLGNADKLFRFKELLDLNIISQEEFDEKKKSLL